MTAKDDDRQVQIAWQYPIRDAKVVDGLLAAPVGTGNGRSPWYWFRLANGDLVAGFYPQGWTYEGNEGPFTDDYQAATEDGTFRIVKADVEDVDPDLELRGPGPDDEQWIGYPRSQATDTWPLSEKGPDEQIDWLLREVTTSDSDVNQRRYDLETLARVITENPEAGYGRMPVDHDVHGPECIICKGVEDFSLDPPGLSRDGHPYMESIPAGTTLYVVDEDGATFVFPYEPHARKAFHDERARGARNLVRFEVGAPRDGMSLDELADFAASAWQVTLTRAPYKDPWPVTSEEKAAYVEWVAEVDHGNTVASFRDWYESRDKD
jgi:hypothetical protein